MAFSFSNWFKTKPGTGDDETDPAAASPTATAVGTPDSAAPSLPSAAPEQKQLTPANAPRPLTTLKSALPNTVKPVALHEPATQGITPPIPLPSLSSNPRPMNAPALNAPRTIAFPSAGGPSPSPTASASHSTLSAPVQAPRPVAPPAAALPDVPIHLELGDFVDKIPGSLLREGPINRARPVVFKASDLYSDLARGRATVPVSAIQALCPEIFQRPIGETEDVEVPLPLPKLVHQLAPALQQRKDQVAEENVGQIETPFLQVALEDNARIPKAAAPRPEPPSPPPAPVAAAPEIPAPVRAPSPAPVAPPPPLAPAAAAPISMPHQPAPAPMTTPPANAPRQPQQPDLRPAQISAVRLSAEGAPAANPLAPPSGPAPIGSTKRPPSTVRASVAGGKIRLSGPTISSRGAGFGAAPAGGQHSSLPTPAAPAHPIVVKPVAPLIAAPSAEASAPGAPGTVLKRTARIQIPPISVRPGAPTSAGAQQKGQPGPMPPTTPPSRLRPMPVTEPMPTFRETPGGARMFPTRPIPAVPPPSALRPLAGRTSPSPTVRTSVPVPPPMPFAPPAPVIHHEEPAAKAAPVELPEAAPTPEPPTMPEAAPISAFAAAPVPELPPLPPEPAAPQLEEASAPEAFAPPSPPPPVPDAPPAEPPAAVHEENRIQLALAAILRALPNSFLAGTDVASGVEDSARVSLPLDLITPQLAHGRVSVSRAVFEAGLPAAHRGVLAAGAEPAEIPLPLQEIFQNLPLSAFTQRQDQVVEEVKPVIPTPFSQKAEEDAQALRAAAAEAAAPVGELEPEVPTAFASAPTPEHVEIAPLTEPDAPALQREEHAPSATEPMAAAEVETVAHSHENVAAEPTTEHQFHPTFSEPIVESHAEPEAESSAPVDAASEAVTESSPAPVLTDHAAASLAAAPVEEEHAMAQADVPEIAQTAEESHVPEHAQENHHTGTAAPAAEEETAVSHEAPPVVAEAPEPAPTSSVSEETIAATAPTLLVAEEPAPTAHAAPVAASAEPFAPATPETTAGPAPGANREALREEAMEALRTVFMVEDDLDAKKVVKHVIQFPGLTACTVMFADGLKLAGTFSAEHESAGFCAMAPAFFQKARLFSRELNLGELHDFSLHTERGLLMSFFMHDAICLSVTHAGRGFLPGVREKLQAVTRALSALYAPQHH